MATVLLLLMICEIFLAVYILAQAVCTSGNGLRANSPTANEGAEDVMRCKQVKMFLTTHDSHE